MNRNLFMVFSVLAMLCLASVAWGASESGGGGGESVPGCVCGQNLPGALPNNICRPKAGACGAPCTTDLTCAAGELCQSKADTACPADGSPGNCHEITASCANGECPAGGPFSDFTTETYVDCPGNIPTLSQWGLILFGMLLLTMMFLVIRRRGLPTHMTASVLLLLAAGFIAVSMSYGAIQSNRSCDVDRNDVAVQLWQEIFSA